MKTMPQPMFQRCLAAFGIVISLLMPFFQQTEQAAEAEVEPFVYASEYSGSIVVTYPSNLEYWSNFAELGDWGALASQGITWDAASGISSVTTDLIFPTNTMPLAFHTNTFSGTYQCDTNTTPWS